MADFVPALLSSAPNYRCLGIGPVLLVLSEGTIQVAQVRQAVDGTRAFFAAHPTGVVVVTVLHQNSPAPDTATRDAIGRWMGEPGERVRAMALVYPGSGFHAATVRAVASGINLFSRLSAPQKVFDAPDVAVAWALDRLTEGPRPTQAVVLAALADALKRASP